MDGSGRAVAALSSAHTGANVSFSTARLLPFFFFSLLKPPLAVLKARSLDFPIPYQTSFSSPFNFLHFYHIVLHSLAAA